MATHLIKYITIFNDIVNTRILSRKLTQRIRRLPHRNLSLLIQKIQQDHLRLGLPQSTPRGSYQYKLRKKNSHRQVHNLHHHLPQNRLITSKRISQEASHPLVRLQSSHLHPITHENRQPALHHPRSRRGRLQRRLHHL